MNNVIDVEMYKLFKDVLGEEKAEQFIGQLNEKFAQKAINEKDKTDLIEKINDVQLQLTLRMDTHFKWLAGIIISCIAIAIALLKTSH